jgi:phosphatidylglycerol:prolipoprotein diacylglycerol transferase
MFGGVPQNGVKMFPFFELFGRSIGMYPIMILCGVFAAGIYVCCVSKKENHDDNDAIFFLLVLSIGVFFGGHILYGIVNYQYLTFLVQDFSQHGKIKIIIADFLGMFGGSVFYGGLLGGIFAAFLYIRKKPNLTYLISIVTPAVPLFHFLGRIGCFLGGCCFGIENSFGITFTHGIVEESNNISRFPVQLLEALFNMSLFLFLHNVRKTNRANANIFYLYLLIYSAGRFAIEYLRADIYRGSILFLSTSQFISIVIFAFSLFKILQKKYVRQFSALNKK